MSMVQNLTLNGSPLYENRYILLITQVSDYNIFVTK